VFEFSLSKLLLLDYTFSPMELLEVLITLPLRKQTYLRVLRELSVPTTADTIAENKTLLLSLERLRLLEQSMIMMRLQL
jgi:hypothetical protein